MRLGQFDIPALLAPKVPAWVSQIGCALVATGLAALCRTALDRVAPGAPPYLFVFPFVLLATGLAGARAGLLTLALIFYIVWRRLLLPSGFDIHRGVDLATLLFSIVSALMVIGVAVLFREASRREIAERTRRLSASELMLSELNHRTKNTLAMMASVVELQRRRAGESTTQAALAQVSARVQGISRAHEALYRAEGDLESVDLGAYLRDLCESLSQSLGGREIVDVSCDCPSLRVSSDRAVAFGLILNELVTNTGKYVPSTINAAASVRVLLERTGGTQCALTVADNGPGLD
jgi:two-component sensor histidine kinase